MSGGGGGSTETTVTNQNLSKEAVPYFTRALDRGEAASQEPYQPYGGQRIADTSADTNRSYDMVRDIANQGTPGTDAAAGIMGLGVGETDKVGAGGPYQYTPFTGYEASKFSEFDYSPTDTWDAGDASKYMDPYLKNVLDTQKASAREAYQMENADRADKAVKAGAFGGSRSAVQQGLAERDLLNRMTDMDYKGLSSAYNDASTRFREDRTFGFDKEKARAAELERVQAGLAGEAERVQAGNAAELDRVQSGQAGENLNYANLGLDKVKLKSDLALNMAELESKARAGDIEAAKLLAAQGKGIEGKDQAGLDLSYEDFLNQRDYPMSNLERYTAMLHGSPLGNTRSTSTSVPTNPVKDYMGLGISALGLSNAMRP